MIWTVPATVVRVVDGDTLILDLDLGWGIHRPLERCRLARINCPELKVDGQSNPAGLAALAFTKDWLQTSAIALARAGGTTLDYGNPAGVPVTFVSRRLDNYGRPLGEVIRLDKANLSDALLGAGHAVPM